MEGNDIQRMITASNRKESTPALVFAPTNKPSKLRWPIIAILGEFIASNSWQCVLIRGINQLAGLVSQYN